MNKPKKIISLLIRILMFFIAFIALMLITTPLLINLEMVRKNIKNTVSTEIGGEIKYRHLDLSYFPRPHVVVHDVELLIPDSFTIKMHRMKVYPKIPPLFLGNLQADIVILENADYFMKLPQISREGPIPEQLASFDDIVEQIFTAIRGLPEFQLPQLKLRIKYGNINLADPLGREFKLREVQADYQRRPNKLDFSIRCKSNLWDQIDVNGFLNPLDFKGKGHIRLTRFRPQALMAYLLHDSALQMTDAKANLTLDVELEGTENLEATVKGAIPHLSLKRGEEQILIKGGHVQGKVRIDGRTVGISLTEMGLDFPRLKATGTFSYDENLQDIQLAIDGSRIDAASVRQVALGLAGESEIIQNIFNIIRGGYVPWMTVRIRGHRIADLGMLDNIVIKGRMTQGKIFIPGAELNLDDVIGDAIISEGILHGENLEATMGNSGGRNGKMTLGLNENIAPFHLKIGVNADLSQLPPVLSRVVRNQDFLNELDLIEDVEGTATGMLTLGDDLPSMKAEVQASNIHLTARYKRIPYKVEIDGGQFNYGGTRLAFDHFNATIGKSSFLNPSIAVDWSSIPILNVNSQSAKFNLDELYTWLLSFEVFKENLRIISGLKGEITTNNLKIEGPFFRPKNWQFQARGRVNKVFLTSKRLPKSLRINRGHFIWQGAKITFNDVEAASGKSSIRRVSGDVNWTKAPIFSTQSGPALFHLEDITPLILSNKNFSTALERFKPLNGSLSFERMKVSGPVTQPSFEQVSISADVKKLMFQTKGLPGPLRIDEGTISWLKNRLAIKEINVSLGNSAISRLSAGFDLGKSSAFEMNSQSLKLFADELFPWLLSFKNVEPFFKDFYVNKGWLFLSNLKLKGPLHVPDQWHYALTGNMKNLVLISDAFGDPVTVNNGSFELTSETKPEAVQNRVWMNETNLTWGGNHLILIGGLVLSKEETLLDLTLTADAIAWNQVNNLVEFAGQKSKEPDSRLSKRDLLGTLKIQTDKFTYETYSVNSLKADLIFKPDLMVITVNEADVCNISLRGQIKYSAQTLQIDLVPKAENQMLAPAVSCITNQKDLAMGTYNMDGRLMSKSKPDEFLQSVSGEIMFSAEQGRIYRFGLLAKILSILNVTEIYRGQLPDLTGEGFAYHGMTISADLEDSRLVMRECSIDGVSMGIACEGDIDLSAKKMDLVVLVAPFKTVDRIVKLLPLIKHILGGKLISIPFRAKGNLMDPQVIPLHPMAVGSGVLGILERTLKLPITIIQPVFSLKENKKADQETNEIKRPTGLP
jgi:AsmA-like C-terminal region